MELCLAHDLLVLLFKLDDSGKFRHQDQDQLGAKEVEKIRFRLAHLILA